MTTTVWHQWNYVFIEFKRKASFVASGNYLLANMSLNSSTGVTNLHFLQNNISLFCIFLKLVGIFPQKRDSLWQFGQFANKGFIPYSLVTFMNQLRKTSILKKWIISTSAKNHVWINRVSNFLPAVGSTTLTTAWFGIPFCKILVGGNLDYSNSLTASTLYFDWNISLISPNKQVFESHYYHSRKKDKKIYCIFFW